MKNTKIILFSAKAKFGKDTSANIAKEILTEKGVSSIIFHFADTLKLICEKSYNWTPGDKGPVGRTILQNVGSNYRKNNKDCWANILHEIAIATDAEVLLVPDCRYQNEVHVFDDMEKYVVRVIRDNYDNGLTEEQKKHISENDMDDYPYNFIIHNDSDIESLSIKVNKIIEEILSK